MAVPVHDRHGITRLDPEPGEHIGQAADPFAQGAVVVAQQVPVDNLMVRVDDYRVSEEVLDQQGISIGRCSSFNQQIVHGHASMVENNGTAI